MAKASNSHFKKGSGVYECRCCGRRTRDSHGEGDITLCAQCYELAGLENMMNDGYDADDYTNDARVYFAELTAKGVADVRSVFPELYDAVYPAAPVAPAADTKREAILAAKRRRAKARREAKKAK